MYVHLQLREFQHTFLLAQNDFNKFLLKLGATLCMLLAMCPHVGKLVFWLQVKGGIVIGDEIGIDIRMEGCKGRNDSFGSGSFLRSGRLLGLRVWLFGFGTRSFVKSKSLLDRGSFFCVLTMLK